MELEPTEIAARLGMAALGGGVIGLNRDFANKPIGTRTLGLVSLGAAVVTLAAIQVPGIAENPDAMSRVVQGIVQGVMAGISFIGAGVILRDAQAKTIEGLTTASTVWLTAALGIACGLAAWWTVLIGCAIALALLLAVPWIEKLFERIRGGTRDPGQR
jgi:putative Mg2+ transporter-C (MgtC) family protein